MLRSASHRSPSRAAVLSTAAGAVASAAVLAVSAAPAHAASYHECQHPVQTGVEVSQLHHVTSHTACPVALDLFAWEQKAGNERRLFRCSGHSPVLKKHSFDGWDLKVTNRYGFTMYRGSKSFVVGGTDFPLNCS